MHVKQKMIWVKYIGRKVSVTQPYNHKKYSWNINTPNGMIEEIPLGLFQILVLTGEYIPVEKPSEEFIKEEEKEEEKNTDNKKIYKFNKKQGKKNE